MVESIKTVVAKSNRSRGRSAASQIKLIVPKPNLRLDCLSPTPACYPLLSIPSCCLLYISDDRVLREEGGGGVEKESRATCVETSSVRYWCYSIYGVCTNLSQ